MSMRPNLKPKDSFHNETNLQEEKFQNQQEDETATTTAALKSATTRMKSTNKTSVDISSRNKPHSQHSDEAGTFQPPIDTTVRRKKIGNKLVTDATVKNAPINMRKKKSFMTSDEKAVDSFLDTLEKQALQELKNAKKSAHASKPANTSRNSKIITKEKTNMPTKVEIKTGTVYKSTDPEENTACDGNNPTQISSLDLETLQDKAATVNAPSDATTANSSPFNFTITPKLVLHSNMLSPQARSCLMLMKYLNLDLEVRDVDQLTCEHLSEDFQKINAWHMIPKLEHNDLVLTDSHTILMYLCVTFPSAAAQQLFPACPLARLKIMNMLFFEAQVLFRRYSNYMTDIVRKEHGKIDFDLHKQKVFEAYEMLNGFLRNSRFLVGNKFTLADISMVATFSAMNLMMPLDSYREYWPHLSNWFERMREMPMYEPNKLGVEKQREIINGFDKSLIPDL